MLQPFIHTFNHRFRKLQISFICFVLIQFQNHIYICFSVKLDHQIIVIEKSLKTPIDFFIPDKCSSHQHFTPIIDQFLLRVFKGRILCYKGILGICKVNLKLFKLVYNALPPIFMDEILCNFLFQHL